MSSWRHSTFTVLDLETTGLDRERDRIVEIGRAHFERGRCRRAEGQLCDPGVPIPAEATRVHHLSDADVCGKPDAGTVLSLWLPALRTGEVLVGYNLLGFDLPILQRELRARGVFWTPRAVDVYAFVDWHLRAWKSRRLTTLALHYHVELARAHSAAADARACGEVLLHLVRQGLIPDDVAAAAAQSEDLRRRLDEEHACFGRWLYRDRKDPRILRMGCGKHQGAALEDVDPGFCRWALGAVADLPAEVRTIFTRRIDARPEAVHG